MKIIRSDDVPKKAVELEGARGVEIRWLITKDDGAENFVMRLFELEPGGCTPLHIHTHEHEVFILQGQGVMVYEKAEHKFKAGYSIFVDGGKEHRFKNTGNSILKFLCLIPASAV